MSNKERPTGALWDEWMATRETLKQRSEQRKQSRSGWSLTPSGRFVKVDLSEEATEALGEIRASEDRRQLLAALFRTLVQRRELSSEGLYGVLSITLSKINAVMNTESAYVLLLDPTIKEANVLCVALGSREVSPARKRRLRYLEQTPLTWRQIGLLREVTEACRVERVAPEDVPEPLQEVMDGSIRELVAVPTTVSQRLTSLLVVTNRAEEDGLGDTEALLLTEIAKHVGRVIQRSLGLGSPLTDEEQCRCLALLAACEFRTTVQPDLELLETLDAKVLERCAILPVKHLGGQRIQVAVANPLDLQSINDFEIMSGLTVDEKITTTREEIGRHLARVLPGVAKPGVVSSNVRGDLVAQLADNLKNLPEISDLRLAEEVTEESAPVVRLASRIIEDAYLRGASDVHIETESKNVVVRYRIDGICRERITLPLTASRPLVARLKIMSQLDIAEHRRPQDGRIDYSKYNSELDIDLRVSVLPMRNGEWVCMRILEKKRSTLPLVELGFSSHNLAAYRDVIRNPCGMILHCGPTGSGKSMTLYAALNELKTSAVKVVTAEDPVEYVLPGIGQLQVRPKLGLTFAHALRSFLRHDPDIILVGEIRDTETARVATEASLTGHLLLSTLHTNDAPSSIARLVKLGIEPYLVANTLLSVCAQRLVRKLCHCKRLSEPTLQERGFLKRAKDGGEVTSIHHANGCAHCNHIGYRGRTGVHELMTLGNRLRQKISEGAPATTIKQTARNEGMRTLFEDSVQRVKMGVTSMEEALRVSHPDEVA